METLDDILKGKPEITIGGETFRLHYNNWVLKNTPLKISLIDLSKIAGDSTIDFSEKLRRFGESIDDTINLIIAGIKTHIIIEHNDLQAIDTNVLSEKTESKIKQIERRLKLEPDMEQMVKYFAVCIKSLTDFMPKPAAKGGDDKTPSLPRRKTKR